MKKLWGGRFNKGMHPTLQCFSYSLYIDFELFEAELEINRAWVKMLAKAGVLKAAEKSRLLQGLKKVEIALKPRDPHDALPKKYLRQYEDVHSLIQDTLEDKIGPVAKKLHTGRSRNDLVVASTRLYLKKKAANLDKKINTLQKALVKSAAQVKDVTVAGMTHLKKAQPILLAHHLLAYVEMLAEDRERLADFAKRLDVLVLGSAALGGSSLPINQKFLARELGFSKITQNSMAAVSDRAFLAELVSDLAILWMHLSRMSEDFILWNNEAFDFVELDDAFATGSSLMPQKKNPDVFELIRGRSSAIFGDLIALLTMQKGLPLAYNRDLQEDKPATFDAIKKTELGLDVLALTIESARFNTHALKESVQEDALYATDILEYLVRKKVPFAEAHSLVGKMIKFSQEVQKPMRDLSLREWKQFSSVFQNDVYDLFNPWVSVSAKKTLGSTQPAMVRQQIAKWQRQLR